jgi:hypothetical protein
MTATQSFEDVIAFMAEYTAFLGRMCADESDKLKALSSKELPRIERSIAVSQANAKQLQNYENKRIAIQEEAGCGGMTFRELIEQAPPGQQEGLWRLFSDFEQNVAEIRFFNDKSMSVARDNMVGLNPGAVFAPRPGTRANNPYARMREERDGQPGMLETKA